MAIDVAATGSLPLIACPSPMTIKCTDTRALEPPLSGMFTLSRVALPRCSFDAVGFHTMENTDTIEAHEHSGLFPCFSCPDELAPPFAADALSGVRPGGLVRDGRFSHKKCGTGQSQ